MRCYEHNNKDEFLWTRWSSGLLLFLKQTQVSSCGFESSLRHFFLFIDIHFLSLFCVSFHCSHCFVVSVNVTSVNILINNNTAFVWFEKKKKYEEKFDY